MRIHFSMHCSVAVSATSTAFKVIGLPKVKKMPMIRPVDVVNVRPTKLFINWFLIFNAVKCVKYVKIMSV